jgi:hypothetical protein
VTAGNRSLAHPSRNGQRYSLRLESYAARLPGDSVLVFDGSEPRATVVGPDLRPGRTILRERNLRTTVVIAWPTLVIMNGDAGPLGRGWGLHRISFAGRTTEIDGSFGPERVAPGPLSYPLLVPRLANPRNGAFWSADGNRYRLSHWTPEGTTRRAQVSRPQLVAPIRSTAFSQISQISQISQMSQITSRWNHGARMDRVFLRRVRDASGRATVGSDVAASRAPRASPLPLVTENAPSAHTMSPAVVGPNTSLAGLIAPAPGIVALVYSDLGPPHDIAVWVNGVGVPVTGLTGS